LEPGLGSTSNLSVDDDASSREDLMVEICVAVDDPICAPGPMRALAMLFDRSSEVIAVVERWSGADGIASARLSIGDRSHTFVSGAWPATTDGCAA
jgi:hypothetical protein